MLKEPERDCLNCRKMGNFCSGSFMGCPSFDPVRLFKKEKIIRGYACVGLDNPKFLSNVGSVLRASGVYGAKMVAIAGKRYSKQRTDTRKEFKHTPFLQVDNLESVIPYDCVSVAVDLIKGATPLPDYKHPERAFYIFGAEDATLGDRITSWCKDIIYIPSNGCMNLAATVNVVLYDRMAKRKEGREIS